MKRPPGSINGDAMNIIQAISDPELFAPWFKDRATWHAWFAFLAALFGLPMTPDQLAVYQACTGRDGPPTAPATEGWLICGRRAGKSFILAIAATFSAAFRNYADYLAPGERATVMVIACDRKQARVIVRYIRALLTKVPMLARMIERETVDAFDLLNGVSIEVQVASYRSTRGYTIAAALCDEMAFWPTDDAAEPDFAVLDALRPGMASIPGAMLLCASNPYAKRGALYDAHRRHFGKDGDPVLIWKAPTLTMNPTVPARVIEEATERDPASAAAEYGAEFRADLEDFVSRESVLACTEIGVAERPPRIGKFKYASFVDPSGGSNDSMTCCIGHREGELIVVDALREITAPFDPESATDEFVNLFRSYGIKTTHGDRYAAAWCSQAFEKRRIEYRHSELPKSGLYLNLLPHLNGKTIKLLDHPRSINQLCSLERRTARGGRDSVDHSQGARDDISNSIAGLAYVVSAPSRGEFSVGYIDSAGRITWPGDAKEDQGSVMYRAEDGSLKIRSPRGAAAHVKTVNHHFI
jgi:hypothetical protein